MAITHAQASVSGTTYGSFTIAITTSSAGHLLTLQYGTTETLGSVLDITSVADSTTQTWTKLVQANSGNNSDSENWYLANATQATHTLTVVCPASGTGSSTYTLDDWAGAATTQSPQSNSAFNNAGTTTSPGPQITPANAGMLVMTTASASTGNISSPGGSWTAFTTSGSTVQLGLYQIGPPSGTPLGAVFTDGSSAAWNQVIAGFQAAATSNPQVMIL